MAGTGLVFVGFVLLHMYGNLKLLSGEAAFNTYAEHLRTFGEPILPRGGLLWILRVVLILSLVGHLYAGLKLWALAGNARRTRYSAARTAIRTKWMRWGGIALLLFLDLAPAAVHDHQDLGQPRRAGRRTSSTTPTDSSWRASRCRG